MHNTRTLSSRLLNCIWWLFTLLMVSSYTANLAAFLTVERMEHSFTSPGDLLEQSTIAFGSYHNGSTASFFRVCHRTNVLSINQCSHHISQDSKSASYRSIWEKMMRDKTSTSSNDEGLKKVRNGNFAFFLESPRLEYEVGFDCDLIQVGKLLNSRYYGVGLQPGVNRKKDIIKLKPLFCI